MQPSCAACTISKQAGLVGTFLTDKVPTPKLASTPALLIFPDHDKAKPNIRGKINWYLTDSFRKISILFNILTYDVTLEMMSVMN